MQNNAFFGLVAYVVDKLLPCGFITIDAVDEAVKEKGLSQGYSRMLTDFLLQEKIVTNPSGDRYDVTPLYLEIIGKGGWIQYTLYKSKQKQLEVDKLRFTTGLSKLQYYTHWPVMVFSVVGMVLGIINVWPSNTIGKNERTIIKQVVVHQVDSLFNAKHDTLDINETELMP